MHLKQKGYCFGVLLLYTITTITLPSVSWCEPNLYYSRPNSHLTRHNDRNGVLKTKVLLTHPFIREARRRLHLDSRQGGESRGLPHLHNLESRDGTQTETSGGKPEQALKPTMASTSTDKRVKNRNKQNQTEGEWMYTSLNPSNEDCSKGEIKQVIYGEVYVTTHFETHAPNVGYLSDSAVSVQARGGQERVRGQRLSGSEPSWQRLRPVVECGDDAMTLTVRRRRAVQLLLDRVNESSVPLSQLPPQCGYSVQTTWRDLSLMARYDACHVTQEDDRYVLPLLWRGTPVKMSCPASQNQPEAVGPSSLCCSPYGMTVNMQGLSAAEELRVNVRGEWTPLVALAEQCGYTLDRQDAEIVIAAPFVTCGITVKDGKYTLSLQIGEKTFTLACPVSPPEELPLTHQPLVSRPRHLTRGPTEHVEPFPWAPPFYLAPPYYPHPTYHHKYSSPNGREAYNPPTPSSSTPDPTFGPQPLPPVDPQPDYQDYYSHQIPVRESYKHFGEHSSLSSTDDLEESGRVYPDLQQKQETRVLSLSEKHSATRSPSSDAGFPIPAEAPPLHPFSQYYHYYHHPKIPLPGPPQDPDPGPEIPRELSLTNPHNPEFPVLPPREALSRVNSDQFFQPVPEAASNPYTLPTSAEFVHKASAPYTPYPPQPYPYRYFYYFPNIAMGEATSSAPLSPDGAAKTNLSDYQNSKLSAFVHPLHHSSEAHDKYNLNPYMDQPKPDTTNLKKNSPEWIKHLLLSDDDDVKAELGDQKSHSAVQPPLPPGYPPGPEAVRVPPPEQPSSPTPSPNHNPPPYPYYYHPYYLYYQMYYGPESLRSADNRVSPTSSKEALDPLLRASSSPPQHQSYSKHQTTPSPTKTMYDVHNGPLHPYYYYYHLYYQPKVSVANQELHPAGSMNSDKESSKSESQLPSDSDYSTMDWLVHAAEAGYPSIPQPLHSSFHSLYSHYITQQHLYDPFGHPDDEEAEERLDEEMTDHLEANPYTPSASPCLGPVSHFDCSVALGCCSYPVNDCTVGQHLIFVMPDSVVESTVAPPAHPSEVSNVFCTLQKLTSDPDIYIVPLDGRGVNKHVSGQTVVHLLEVYDAHSPQQDHSYVHDYSPVRLMVGCRSSPGSPGEVRPTVTVHLRLATDESFTSFHPEAHLPLCLIRGRPVYVEVSLLDPPEPGLVLLVHSCLAYTQAPYTSWMLVYDGNFQG
ncbi:uncharacterized protein LOC122869389 isoform X2 [Siniperca chuatsi]|uniref:uncharacterized protein LOC122869389 isoform X2 n=1 Tax=Siniperca chuatsi TaxID=119488 RepID=UPI001CE11FE5|nr:uncharacterized protein LOC122869389 isoform X2 [Siniperca chuatsi]